MRSLMFLSRNETFLVRDVQRTHGQFSITVRKWRGFSASLLQDVRVKRTLEDSRSWHFYDTFRFITIAERETARKTLLANILNETRAIKRGKFSYWTGKSSITTRTDLAQTSAGGGDDYLDIPSQETARMREIMR